MLCGWLEDAQNNACMTPTPPVESVHEKQLLQSLGFGHFGDALQDGLSGERPRIGKSVKFQEASHHITVVWYSYISAHIIFDSRVCVAESDKT